MAASPRTFRAAEPMTATGKGEGSFIAAAGIETAEGNPSSVIGKDLGSGFTTQSRQRLVQVADDDAPAAGFEKTDGRFDLWSHAARREMALRVVGADLR